MHRTNQPGHDHAGDLEVNILPCRMHLVPAPATPVQLTAWRQLWARLLDHVETGLEKPQPQDHVDPGAATVATVGSGHNSELNNDTTDCILST